MKAVIFRPKVKKTASDRRRELRDSLWPGSGKLIWSRKTDDGYCSVPRTLPLIMTLINMMSGKEGDASRVYFELWCRAYDEGFIEMADEADHAFAAGYVSSRGVRTWRERMDLLTDLGFIKVKPKGSWKYGYVLLVHPHDVVETLKTTKQVPDEWYSAYLHRSGQIGARAGKAAKTKTA